MALTPLPSGKDPATNVEPQQMQVRPDGVRSPAIGGLISPQAPASIHGTSPRANQKALAEDSASLQAITAGNLLGQVGKVAPEAFCPPPQAYRERERAAMTVHRSLPGTQATQLGIESGETPAIAPVDAPPASPKTSTHPSSGLMVRRKV